MRLDWILFPEGKEKAVTFGFDDAVVEDRKMTALLKKYHLKGTFYVNSGCFSEKERMPFKDRELYHEVISEDELLDLYIGQEVAAHGFSHLSMTDCPTDSALAEVVRDRIQLEHLIGKRVQGFAYPYGHYNNESKELLRRAGIKFARTVERADSFDLPVDFFSWNPTCHILDEDRDQLLDRFLEIGVTPYSPSPKIFYIWGHSYEITIADGWTEWEFFLKRISGRIDDVWYATNGEIQQYTEAVQRLSYSADRSIIYNPSAIPVWLNLDGQPVKLESGAEKKFSH